MKINLKLFLAILIGAILIALGTYSLMDSIACMTSYGTVFNPISFSFGMLFFIIAGIVIIVALKKKIERLVVSISIVIIILISSLLVFLAIQKRDEFEVPVIGINLVSNDVINHTATFQIIDTDDCYWSEFRVVLENETGSRVEVDIITDDTDGTISTGDQFSIEADAPGEYWIDILHIPSNCIIWSKSITL